MSTPLFIFSLLLFLFSSISIQAQTTPQGRLDALNKQIQECKEDIELVESMLNSIEGVNNELTISARKEWNKRLDANKKCLDQAQKELDFLKAFYPSLFMPPSTTADSKPDRDRADKALQRLAKEIAESLTDAINKQSNLQKLIDDLMKDD